MASVERPVDRRPGWRVAAVVALLGLVLTGCGGPRGSVPESDGGDAASPSVVEAERLFDEIAGGMLPTQAQSDAVLYLEHVAFQGMIIDCMAGKGFVYLGVPAFQVPSPIGVFGGPEGVLDPVDPAAVEADGLGLDATLAGLVKNAKAGEPIVLDISGMNGPPPPEHEVPGWDEALGECDPSTEELDARVAHPSYERAQPVTDLLEEVLASKPVMSAVATYPGCMRAAGWPVRDRSQLVSEVRGGFEDLLVDAAGSFSGDPGRRAGQVDELVGSAEWGGLVEARSGAATADAACRQEAHDLAFTALLEPLRGLRTEQHAAIEQLRAE